jgi:cytochrome c peroxidase
MRTSFAVGLVALAIIAACDEKKAPPAPEPGPTATGESASTASSSKPSGGIPKFDPDQTRLFQPIPEGVEKPTLDEATKLGQMLFWDTRLSASGKLACVTCHDFSKAGADGLMKPAVAARSNDAGAADSGVAGAELPRNTPTVFNCGGSFAQGWDGRASTPEEFATLHTLDASVMGVADEQKLVAILSGIPAYAAAFKKAFPDDSPSISGETYGKAVGGFTKKLFARARWDKFLGGDKSAVTTEELSGFAMFVEAGCTSCHQGKYIGATQLQKLGMAKPWPPPAGNDAGRFTFSKQEMDRGMWKVPSLRNVTRTGPYLHDGSIATLAEISKLMARHQVGKEINDEQAGAIAKFLGTLEGDPPKVLTEKPSLPK